MLDLENHGKDHRSSQSWIVLAQTQRCEAERYRPAQIGVWMGYTDSSPRHGRTAGNKPQIKTQRGIETNALDLLCLMLLGDGISEG